MKEEAKNICEADVGQPVEDEDHPGGPKCISAGQGIDAHALSNGYGDGCQKKVKNEIVDKVGSPVSCDIHATNYLLMF